MKKLIAFAISLIQNKDRRIFRKSFGLLNASDKKNRY